jgi:amidase
MSPHLNSLELGMKAILSTCPWEEDYEVVDLPWSQEKLHRVQELSCDEGQTNGRLVFGIMNWDGNVNPHPPVQRAMKLLVDALEERGYEVSDYLKVRESGAHNFLRLFSGDHHRTLQLSMCS